MYKKNKILYILISIVTIAIISFIFKEISYSVDDNITSVTLSDRELYNALASELKEIIVSKNYSKKLLNVRDIESVNSLNLTNKGIVELDGIENFTSLKKLELYGNSIKNISSINALTNLEYLDLSSCKLDDSNKDNNIISTISNLTNLKYLDMSYNYITSLDGIENMNKLTYINMFHNGLTNIDGIQSLEDLAYLNLGNNKIGNNGGPSQISNCKKLKYLNFSSNSSSNILQYVNNLSQLEELYVQNNSITDVSPLSNLTNLRKLDLFQNKIGNSSSNVVVLNNLSNLEVLDLGSNNLTDISFLYNEQEDKIYLNKLEKLDIVNNYNKSNGIIDSDGLKYLIKKANDGEIELNYENITDTSNLPHKDGSISYVTYDDFGARADGVYDDFIAIRNAHVYANQYGYEVRATSGKEYHIFKNNENVVHVKTNVNWMNATFIIHDEEVFEMYSRAKSIFQFGNIKSTITIKNPNIVINKSTKKIDDFKQLLIENNINGYKKYLVNVYNSEKKQFIRIGSNANNGSTQTDIFLCDENGILLNDVQWDFEKVTSIEISGIPEEKMIVKNGKFITMATNKATFATLVHGNSNYFYRGLFFNNVANAEISGITHELSEDRFSATYTGFLKLSHVADINVSDCEFFSRYGTLHSSYGLTYDYAVNVYFKNIKQKNDIYASNHWGVTGGNFLKDIVFDSCSLNRIDVHQGVYNLTVKNCNVGNYAINVVGQGDLNVYNTKIKSSYFIRLRSDYSSTWNGNVYINDCTLVPPAGKSIGIVDYTINFDDNKELVDVGYQPKFPNVYINNFTFDYSNEANQVDTVYVIPKRTNFNELGSIPYWNKQVFINNYTFVNTNLTPKLNLAPSDIQNPDDVNYFLSDFSFKNHGNSIMNSDGNLEKKVYNDNVELSINKSSDYLNYLTVYLNNEIVVNERLVDDNLNMSFDEIGNYKVIIKSLQEVDTKVFSGIKEYNFVINKSDEISVNKKIVDYTGNNVEADVVSLSGENVNITYYNDEICANKINGLPVNVGKYYIIASTNDSDNYYGTITSCQEAITINKIDAICPTISDYIEIYDGNSHGIIVNGGSGGTIEYRTSSEDEWSNTIPTRKDVGETTVYVQIKGDSNHNTKNCGSKNITINEKIVNNTLKDILENNGYSIKNGYVTFTLGEEIATIKNKLGSDIIIEADKDVMATGIVIKKENESYTIVIKGDINKDGKIKALDYIAIRNHMMNTNIINNNSIEFMAADMNNDDKISALDYIAIRNIMMKN